MSEAVLGQDHLSSLRARLASHPEVAIDVPGRQLLLRSRHGLFSARSLDEGTVLLLRELESLEPAMRILDLGCGYGALGLTLAARWPGSRVDLVDIDIRAVEAASENVARNGLDNATVTLSDGTRELSGRRFRV